MSIKLNNMSLPSSLATVPRGQSASVVAVDVPGALGERLMELGITPGATVRVMRRGAFGDPVQVFLRGYMLSVRKTEASAIRVRPV